MKLTLNYIKRNTIMNIFLFKLEYQSNEMNTKYKDKLTTVYR